MVIIYWGLRPYLYEFLRIEILEGSQVKQMRVMHSPGSLLGNVFGATMPSKSGVSAFWNLFSHDCDKDLTQAHTHMNEMGER